MRKPAVVTSLFALALAATLATPVRADTVLRVMTFNVWGGGANEGQPVDQTATAIREAGADIVGIQETRPESPDCTEESCPPAGESVAARLAQALGFHYYDQLAKNEALWSNAILSRYPIGKATPNDLGVAIDVDGRRVYAFNIHLTDYPYQPYQLSGIPYGAAPMLRSGEEAVKSAEAARGTGIALLVDDLKVAQDADAVFVFGDFNEPSHRDWTPRAAEAGRVPLAVHFPSVRALESQGFTDAYRAARPDEVAHPGHTWEAIARPPDVAVRHDRIDYVLVRGPGLVLEDARVVGEKSPEADLVVTPWPSDHRAVVATVRFPPGVTPPRANPTAAAAPAGPVRPAW